MKRDLLIKSNEVVLCSTPELARKVLDLAHNLGYKWNSGIIFLGEDTEWSTYNDETCYLLPEGQYSSKTFYIDAGYSIITAKEFISRHNEPLSRYKTVIDLFLTKEVPLELVSNYYLGEDDFVLTEFILNHLRTDVEWSTAIGVLDTAKLIVEEAKNNCNI